MAEVWLRELPVELDPVRHLLLCTLQQAREDVSAHLKSMTDEQLWARPAGLTPVGFHIRHIAESIDRLLTYAEGRQLSEEQLDVLRVESTEQLSAAELLALLEKKLDEAWERLVALDTASLGEARHIGRKRIAVPMGTLLGHIAEHTQRHLGQIATTAKLLAGT